MQSILRKVMFVLLGTIFLFAMAGSIHHISVYARMTAEYTHNQQYWTILGMIVLLVCACAFSDYVVKKENHRKWVVRVLWLILHLGEIFWMHIFYCYPTSDSAEVVHGAIQIANGNSQYLEYTEYFHKYGNNNLLTIFTAKIYQISQILCNGNTDYIFLNNMLNIFLLNLSVYLGYAMIKKYKGEENACKMLFLSVLNPVMYMAVFWYYSATVSIFFSMCILYLALGRDAKDDVGKKIRVTVRHHEPLQMKKQIGLGICTAVGYMIRPTVIITTIAVVLISFLQSVRKKESLISFLKKLGIVCISFYICVAGLQALSGTYFSDQRQTYPITHWISMGIEGDGTNSSYGDNYPEEIKEKGERLSYDIHRIKQNLSEYNPVSFGKHIAKKLYINWCDGSSAMNVKLKSDVKFSKFYDIFVSQRADGWLIYCQTFRAFTFLLMLFSVIKNFTKTLSGEDILYLNVFGAVLFYMIWEVKSDYSIPFLLMFFCIASDGMDWHRKFLPTDIQRQNKKMALAGILLSGIFGILLFWNYRKWYTEKMYDFTENIVAMNGTKPMKIIEEIGKNHTTITQNVKVDKSFHIIKLYCKKRKGDGTYTIGLYQNINGQKQCIQEWKNVSGKQVKRGQEEDSLFYDDGNKKGYLILSCDDTPEQGDYILQITPDSKKDSIDWYYNPYGEFDYYDGDMFWNEEKQQGELALCITRHTRESYF